MKQNVFIMLAASVTFLCLGCDRPQPRKMAAGNPDQVLQPGRGQTAKSESDRLWSEAARIVSEGLRNENPRVRANAVEVVAATKHIELMPLVRRLLGDEYVPVRFAAAVAVGDVGYTFGRSDTAELLKDEDENVRVAAAYVLYMLGSADRIEAIRKAVKSSNQTVRANAAMLLGKSGNQGSLELLYWALKDDNSDDRVRLNAAEAIARLGDERIYQKLWTMLISVYHDFRVSGVKAMGALGTVQARDALLTMLDDEVAEVRLAAAEQLGLLQDTSGQSEVIRVFEDRSVVSTDEQARRRLYGLAALAIGRICSLSVTKYLPQLLTDDSVYVRLAAAQAVLQCRNGETIGLSQ